MWNSTVMGRDVGEAAAALGGGTTGYGSYWPRIDQFYIPPWLDVQFLANNIISFTPLFSYGTTVWSINRSKTALGFSIDICATMLIASILRVSYYLITPYEVALLRQSLVMIFIQMILLYTSLCYRPEEYKYESLKPVEPFAQLSQDVWQEFFPLCSMGAGWKGIWQAMSLNSVAGYAEKMLLVALYKFLKFFDPGYQRIGAFWQWNNPRYFWLFLLWFTCGQFLMTFFIARVMNWEWLGQWLGSFIGSLGLLIEALLPLPQISILHTLKSVQGFKLILLVSWLCGDILKISYLVFGAKNISMIFFLFALFQMGLDIYIAFIYVYYKYYFPKYRRKSEPPRIEMQMLLSNGDAAAINV
ncbi:AaceriADR022Wp [[Ashbya] aceris (nom. inval.)]|nr:AaceriADR022Wp [[Ashbya] aceris (nom. inval.)]